MKKVLLLACGLFLLLSSPSSAYQLLNADTLNNWLTNRSPFDFLLIDVRETSEMTNIIATETCRPYHLAWTSLSFDSSKALLPKTTAIIIYCASGGRSGQAATALDNAGFSMVYSLSGGFSGWHGSTKPFSYVKPVSDLPAPSLIASSVMDRPTAVRSSRRISLSAKNGILFSNQRLSRPHSVSIFSMNGQCILERRDLFSEQTRCDLSADLCRGVYLVRLETASLEPVQAILHLF
jgi:rhodanese-related sulfurtransferase